MSQSLSYSMRELAPIVLPALELAGARSIVNIGSDDVGMADELATYCERLGGHLTTIAPAASADHLRWSEETPHVTHLSGTGMACIPRAGAADAWLLDGDHNWYTIYHELSAIRGLCRAARRPMLALVHEVSWPCARRDAYEAPEAIPAAFRQPHTFVGGVELDTQLAIPHRGLQGSGRYAWATIEGGERNGVLTAVEDFVAEAADAGDRLGWAFVPAIFGLGVVFDLDAPWALAMSSFLAPYHNNPELAALEEQRIRTYLDAINSALTVAQAA